MISLPYIIGHYTTKLGGPPARAEMKKLTA